MWVALGFAGGIFSEALEALPTPTSVCEEYPHDEADAHSEDAEIVKETCMCPECTKMVLEVPSESEQSETGIAAARAHVPSAKRGGHV